MSKTTINIPDIGDVDFVKNPRAKNIRIHINGSKIKVTYPRYVSRTLARSYVVSKKTWINNHKSKIHVFHSGDLIGKQHKLVLETSNITKISSKVTNNTLHINVPMGVDAYSASVQTKIHSKIEKILKTESEDLVTDRLKDISFENNIDYRSINYKKLTRRWGSCDNKKNIILNLYLVQLPWDLINYVIVHELAHTIELNHSPKFWNIVESIIPDYKKLKTQLNKHSPEAYVF